MATEVSICSNALRRLGDDPITSLTDDSERARLCNSFYADTRDSVLRSHPFNFSITRTTLAQLSDKPTYGFGFQYALPTNPFCLRVLEMEETDTNLFDAMFVDVLTAKLAVDLAYPVTSSMAVQKQMQDLFQKKLSEARSIDGQEGFMDDLVSDTFTDFRK